MDDALSVATLTIKASPDGEPPRRLVLVSSDHFSSHPLPAGSTLVVGRAPESDVVLTSPA